MGDDERTRRHQILRRQHTGVTGAAIDIWRAAIEDLEDIPFGGVGVWRQIAPPEIDVARGQLFRGTGPNAGEVRDIAIDPAGGDQPTIAIATNGGVWKSDDGGAHWRSISDGVPTSAIGAVGIDPGVEDIIYAGSRNLVDGEGTVPRAMGVFRTNDGGKTWAPIDGGPDATVMNRGVNRMVCPSPNLVLIGCPNGLFLSTDGGATFGANAPDFNDLRPILEGNVTALEIDTAFRVARTIESTSATTPIVVKCANHGFLKDEAVSVGRTEDDGARGTFSVDPIDDKSFKLRDSEGTGTGSTRGVVIGPNHPRSLSISAANGPTPAGPIVLTVAAHGLISDDVVVVTGVTGLSAANGSWRVKVLTDSTFELVGSKGSGTSGSTGLVLAAPRSEPVAIVSADNVGTGIKLSVPGHGLRTGDRVSLTGVPGVPTTSVGIVSVHTEKEPGTGRDVIAPDIIVSGLQRTAGNLAPNPVVVGPAASWNMAYVAVGGRKADGKTRADTRGLYRVTLSGTGATRALTISKNLLVGSAVPANYNVVRVAQGTVRPRTLYVALQDTTPSTRFLTLLRSDDHGDTWKRALVEMPGGITKDGTDGSDDAFTLGVDPQDDGRVYLGLRQLWRSVDAGAMFPEMRVDTEGGDMHAVLGRVGLATSASLLPRDHYAIAFFPATFWPEPGIAPPITPMLFGTSGGIARSDTGGGAFVHLNHGLSTTDLLAVGMAEEKPDGTFVGGRHIGISGQIKQTRLPLTQGILGDASTIAVDPVDPKIVYGFVDGRFVRTVNGGEDWQTSTAPARPIVTAVTHAAGELAVAVNTLGHSFVDGDSVTISGVQSNGADFNKVNGSRKLRIATDETFIPDLSVTDVETFPPFDPVAQASGKRFTDGIAIAKVTGGSAINIETAVSHGIFAPIEVHVEGVVGIPEANNDISHLSWIADRVSDTVLTIPVSSASTDAVIQDRARIRFLSVTDTVPVQFATFQDPIVVTALNHSFVTGGTVTITGARGNTKANVTNRAITVLDRNSFRLDGVAGNAAWGAQPAVEGKPMARKLPAAARSDRTCISLLAHRNPTTNELISSTHTVFASVRNELYRSDDDGHSFSLLRRFDADVTALLTPKDNVIWVGLANGQVQSSIGPNVWRGPGRDAYVPNVGARGPITGIAVEPGNDPTNEKHIVVVAAGYTGLHRNRGTHHIFETTTGGEKTSADSPAWKEINGPTITLSRGITPDLPALAVAFVKVTGFAELVVATDGGLISPTTDPHDRWTRRGPNLPNVSCQSLAVFNPPGPGVQGTLRLATAGRGLWELERPNRPELMLRTSLGFGDRAINTSTVLKIIAVNVGKGILKVMNATSDITPAFETISLPIPRTLTEGQHTELEVTFRPTSLGSVEGTISVEWVRDGETTHQFTTVDASGVGVPPGLPRVCVRSTALRFGRVTVNDDVEIPVVVRNTGTGDADITALALNPSTGPFTMTIGTGTVTFPIRLKASESLTVKVKFAPKSAGAKSARLELHSQPAPGGVPQPPRTITIDISGEGTAKAGDYLNPLLAILGLADQPADALT